MTRSQIKEYRMPSNISRRQLLSTGLAAVGGTLAAGALAADKAKEKAKAPANSGQLTLDGLGNLLASLGLKATREKTQFNFTFPAKLDVEWNMTMSAVLSTDEETIWLMAWLNELPKSASDVPRTALLRLLAENDKMGKAFFAYIPSTRRFVLERVIDNQDITPTTFKEDMLDLARLVIDTQSAWTVSEWKSSTASPGDGVKDASKEDAPSFLTGTSGAKPIKSATKDAPSSGAASPKKK
jgi:hypothetical protein